MAQYTKRTCVNCGLRDIQPNMRQKEIYAESGRSKKGVSGSTVTGWLVFGNKKSARSVVDTVFNNNQRTYYRKRKVWLCGNCYGKVRSENSANNNWVFWIILILTSPLWFAFLEGFISGL